MATQIILHNNSSIKKRPPLYSRSGVATRRRSRARLGEVSGKVMADCSAVCCCYPLGVANVVFFVVYKVPVGLCRMALKNNRRRRIVKKGHCLYCDESELQIHPMMFVEEVSESDSEAMMRLEKEMSERFYGGGFWRSPSQKEEGDAFNQ